MTADLWDFATTLYARPGVEAACLTQQDAGTDVCLLLCGLWLDRLGTPHNGEFEAQLRQIAAHWQRDVVKPLRALRQAWRTSAQQDPALADLRQRVKQLELDAEREQLLRLEALAQSWPQQPSSGQRDWLDALASVASAPAVEAREHLYGASLTNGLD
ncbi:TIGR02444 family protein [Pseudomonas daroniae]|uniref:TIGR02444 family protein n=1 Tax=Phytopseudomonas daroniae TaxID=2487519 RepID=A0A4Q9QS35_9GAMM|nr:MULTISPECIES: TIGR02444 family protein [Pseudomonas]TBU82984.1 TIGR02444 family protein [Pseudomonas sp. FRB 228]TBU84003.1 TIGR02444 family protein [Pseudomonas daroniae]TBU93181.1 TIGR02444 family protein [Pseudomonas daroniae]